MKNLLLLRHATTASAHHPQSDHDRLLTSFGEKQALSLGRLLKKSSITPDLILSSDAARTSQTTELIIEGLETHIPVIKKREIYNSSSDTLLKHIKNINKEIDTLLVVNHNPAIHQLSFDLSNGNTQIALSYPPCSLTHLLYDEDDWHFLERSKTHFQTFYSGDLFPKPL